MEKTTIPFKAKLSENLIKLPKTVSKKLPSSVIIEGVANHFPFRAKLENGQIKLSSAIQKAANINPNDKTDIEITRVADEPETRIPSDLKKALKDNPKAKDAWNKTTPMARRDWVLSILTVKQEETRKIRIKKTISMLESGKGRVCCFPGINWMTKDKVKPNETWLRLNQH